MDQAHQCADDGVEALVWEWQRLNIPRHEPQLVCWQACILGCLLCILRHGGIDIYASHLYVLQRAIPMFSWSIQDVGSAHAVSPMHVIPNPGACTMWRNCHLAAVVSEIGPCAHAELQDVCARYHGISKEAALERRNLSFVLLHCCCHAQRKVPGSQQ